MALNASILGCEGLSVTDWEKAFFRDSDPFGFILFARNIDTPDQLRQLTADLREAVGRDAPILIDQEGGRVQRMRAPHWHEWLPPLDQMEQASDPIRAMWLRNRIIADELRAVGIDANCAPCADIVGPDTHPFLRNRCYGIDLETVIAASVAAADNADTVQTFYDLLSNPGSETHAAAFVNATADTWESVVTIPVATKAATRSWDKSEDLPDCYRISTGKFRSFTKAVIS